MEPPNKGHFRSGAFVLYSEVVLWWEVRIKLLFLAASALKSLPNMHRMSSSIQHSLGLYVKTLVLCDTTILYLASARDFM